MKIYYCDICSCQMPDERHMMIPMRRFDGEEDFVIQCKDNCGFRHADICKRCEDKIKNAIQESVGLGYPVYTDEPDKTELYFDDCEACKFYRNGECLNMDRPDTIICDDGHNNKCYYRDPEKKTLSEAIVKESEEE